MAPRRHGRCPDTAESGAARSLAVTESKRPPDTNNTKPSQNADARAVPGPPVALVAGAGWNVRYPAEALALSAGALAVPAPWPAAGRRWPSSNSSWVRRMRRSRVISCLASSTQQMNSFRARGMMSFQASSAVGLAISARAQVCGMLVHCPTGHSLAAHRATVAVQGPACFTNSAAPIAEYLRAGCQPVCAISGGQIIRFGVATVIYRSWVLSAIEYLELLAVADVAGRRAHDN